MGKADKRRKRAKEKKKQANIEKTKRVEATGSVVFKRVFRYHKKGKNKAEQDFYKICHKKEIKQAAIKYAPNQQVAMRINQEGDNGQEVDDDSEMSK